MIWRLSVLVFLGAVLLAGTSIFFGVRAIPPSVVIAAFTSFDATDTDHLIIRELRIWRALAVLLCGGALGVAGALMQVLARNPLADPGILGVNAGAAFGVLIGIWGLGLTAPGTLIAPALVGAGIASILVFALGSGSSKTGPDPVRLVLAGAALSALFMALTWALLIVSRQTLDVYRHWVLGGFAQVDVADLFALFPIFAAGFVVSGFAALMMNPLALGDDTAKALGARVALARVISIIAIVLLCACSVSLAGPIAFIGLIVPHLVRPFTYGDVRKLVFGSLIVGAALSAVADVLGRVLIPGQEIEAGAMMALIGGPALILLVQRSRAVKL